MRVESRQIWSAGEGRRQQADRPLGAGGHRSRCLGKGTFNVWSYMVCFAGMWEVFAPTVAVTGAAAAHGGPRDITRCRAVAVGTPVLQALHPRHNGWGSCTVAPRALQMLRIRGGTDDVLLADSVGGVGGLEMLEDEYGGEFGDGVLEGEGDSLAEQLRAEIDEIERELEEAQDARAVAEQVNVRLKSAMEEQSLEIVRLRGLLGSMGVNASGNWATPAADASRKIDVSQAHTEEVEKLRDMLSSKMDQAKTLLREKERTEMTWSPLSARSVVCGKC
jgi:hypothetical protein